MYKAACYCRLSSDDLKDGMSVSIDTQIALEKKYCKENRIHIVDFYCDDGYTGTNFERPEFKRMMSDIRKGKADTIIVKDLSRFGRESIMVNYYTQIYFPENNIRFIAISDDTIITQNSRYDIMLPLKSVINEIYPAEVSAKVRQAMDIKAQDGEFFHPYLPYGYVKSKVFRNNLEVDEETAPIVRKIFELAAYEGYGIMRIADYLYENKVLSPLALKSIREGKEPGENPYGWCKSTISNLLNNEVYLGKIIYGKTRKVNFKSKKVVKTDKSEWIVVDDAHEPIITQKLWDDKPRLDVFIITKGQLSDKQLIYGFFGCVLRIGFVLEYNKCMGINRICVLSGNSFKFVFVCDMITFLCSVPIIFSSKNVFHILQCVSGLFCHNNYYICIVA